MKFEIETTFEGITLEQFVKLNYDPDFNSAMAKHIKLQREVLKHEETDEFIIEELKTAPNRDLPGFMKKLIRSGRLEYHEKSKFNKNTHKGTWNTTPNVMPGKVKTDGTFEFIAVSENQVKRHVTGDINVKIVGLGSAIEKFIVKNIKDSYELCDAFMQQWISNKLEK